MSVGTHKPLFNTYYNLLSKLQCYKLKNSVNMGPGDNTLPIKWAKNGPTETKLAKPFQILKDTGPVLMGFLTNRAWWHTTLMPLSIDFSSLILAFFTKNILFCKPGCDYKTTWHYLKLQQSGKKWTIWRAFSKFSGREHVPLNIWVLLKNFKQNQFKVSLTAQEIGKFPFSWDAMKALQAVQHRDTCKLSFI